VALEVSIDGGYTWTADRVRFHVFAQTGVSVAGSVSWTRCGWFLGVNIRERLCKFFVSCVLVLFVVSQYRTLELNPRRM
jgi:hypothetical protein